MKFISSRTHGVLDYLVGTLLILAPFLLGFANDGPAQWVPVFLGAGTILYSLLTRYELGAVKVIPFKTHLALDFLAGLFLAASPWLFNFAAIVWIPHVIGGVLEIVASLTTRSTTGDLPSDPLSRPHTPGHLAPPSTPAR